MGRELGEGWFGLDDLKIGDGFDTSSREVTPELIEDFARLSGDHFEIHLSDAAAIRHGFAAQVAHGLLVLSLVDGLKQQAVPKLKARAALGWELRFEAPVLAGDSIQARVQVESLRRLKNSEQGIVGLQQIVTNQRGETVQAGLNRLMLYR